MRDETQTGAGGSFDAGSTLARLRSEVAALDRLDVDLLRKRWRSVMGRPAPSRVSRGLLFRVLAHRLQTDALGMFDAATNNVSTARGRDGASGKSRSASSGSPKTPGVLVKPGTLLIREHGGVTHRVMAIEDGYNWNGKTFRSLSEVAQAITGTKWNGPRFFGLRPLKTTGREEKPPGDGDDASADATHGAS